MTAVPAVVASGSRLEPEDSCLLEVVELVCTGWEDDPAPSTTLTSFNREPCELAGEPALEEPLCRVVISSYEDSGYVHALNELVQRLDGDAASRVSFNSRKPDSVFEELFAEAGGG